MSLQKRSFFTLFDQLTSDARDEVIAHILDSMTLDEVLLHPSVAEGYRQVLQRRHLPHGQMAIANLCNQRLIKLTKDVRLLRHLYEIPTGYLNVHAMDTYRIMYRAGRAGTPDVVVMFDWRMAKFVPADAVVEPFDFFGYVTTEDGLKPFPLEQLMVLEPERFRPNPEWVPDSVEPMSLPVGSKLVPWYERCIDEY